jgi:hypothetical protein
MHLRFYMHEHLIIKWNLPKFHTSIYKSCGECKMELMNDGFNTFKVNDSSHVQMLIIFKMWKNSLPIQI